MLDLAAATGVISTDQHAQSRDILERFAALSGEADALTLPLTLKNGYVMLGFIPLAPAPRIFIP